MVERENRGHVDRQCCWFPLVIHGDVMEQSIGELDSKSAYCVFCSKIARGMADRGGDGDGSMEDEWWRHGLFVNLQPLRRFPFWNGANRQTREEHRLNATNRTRVVPWTVPWVEGPNRWMALRDHLEIIGVARKDSILDGPLQLDDDGQYVESRIMLEGSDKTLLTSDGPN